MKYRATRRQKGLSIIELMIALLLGLLLMGGVMQVFLSSRQTYQTNSALSQVQESGRFALDFLAYDLKHAGYRGDCLFPLYDPTPTTLTKDERYVLGTGIEGWNDAGENSIPGWLNDIYTTSRRAGTDVILLKHAAGATGIALSNPVSADATTINTTATTGQIPGSLLIISDTAGCQLFINQSAANATTLTTLQAINRPYAQTAVISNFQSSLYYIGQSSVAAGLPALRRIRYLATADARPLVADEELVSGIQDLQIQYAVGNSNGQITGQYRDAQEINDWQSVISAQISLIAVSRDTQAVSPDQQLTFRGDKVPLDNGRLGQVFNLTVSIRNHLP